MIPTKHEHRAERRRDMSKPDTSAYNRGGGVMADGNGTKLEDIHDGSPIRQGIRD